ncbi:MAG: hypothetical protein QM723_29295 [Myxococcaceae bacterium]
MRGLFLVMTAVVLARGRPPGPTAAPSLSTPEFSAEGHLASEPITDHSTVVQFTLTAQPGHSLDSASFDVGGGCCFEQTHYDRPAREACREDAAKTCRVVFEVPYRLSGSGQVSGSIAFNVCDAYACSPRKVAVLVPYKTRD